MSHSVMLLHKGSLACSSGVAVLLVLQPSELVSLPYLKLGSGHAGEIRSGGLACAAKAKHEQNNNY